MLKLLFDMHVCITTSVSSVWPTEYATVSALAGVSADEGLFVFSSS